MKNYDVTKRINGIKWNINPINRGEDNHDPKPADKFNIHSLQQEGGQNAIDQQSGDKTVVLSFSERFCYRDDLVNEFLGDEFLNILDHMPRSRLTRQEVLQADRVNCLIMEDFNTTGLVGDPSYYNDELENGVRNGIHIFNNQFGNMGKLNNAKLGGSEGEGRFTYCMASDISTFFYYNVNEDHEECIYGICYAGITKKDMKEYPSIIRYGSIVDDEKKKWTVPITDTTKIEKFKEVFNISRKNDEPGLSIVVPFLSSNTNLKKGIPIFVQNYRIPILKDQLIVKTKEVEINSSSLLEYYNKAIIKNNAKETKAIKKYFEFIYKTSLTSNYKTYTLKINKADYKKLDPKIYPEFDQIIRDYKRNKLICFRIEFSIVKKKKNQSSETINTYWESFWQKPIEAHGTNIALSDIVRGHMPLTQMKQRMSDFMFTLVEDDEAMLFIKTGEVANHTKILIRHPKYEEKYSKEYLSASTFFSSHMKVISKFLNDSNDEYDDTTTADLISDYEDADGNFGNKNEDDNDTGYISIKDLPKIPPMIHRYTTNIIKHGGWQIKGNKYSNEQIEAFLEEADLYIDKAKEALKEKQKLEIETIQKINQGIISAENRIKQYEKYLNGKLKLFPTKVIVSFGFEDGSKSPEKNYSPNDFDLADRSIFKYKSEGSASMSVCLNNKLEIDIINEDFSFEVSGFGKDSERQVGVHHVARDILE